MSNAKYSLSVIELKSTPDEAMLARFALRIHLWAEDGTSLGSSTTWGCRIVHSSSEKMFVAPPLGPLADSGRHLNTMTWSPEFQGHVLSLVLDQLRHLVESVERALQAETERSQPDLPVSPPSEVVDSEEEEIPF
jgi:hypothetical protein